MSLVEVMRRCPVCGVPGWYEMQGGVAGKGRGMPKLTWLMRTCGHSFSTPEYARYSDGWVRVDPDSLDAQLCE